MLINHRSFKYGFLVGFVGVFVATLGLILRFVEIISIPFLWVAKLILSPIDFSSTPGIVSILLLAIVNGIFYGLVFFLITKLFKNNQPDNIKPPTQQS